MGQTQLHANRRAFIGGSDARIIMGMAALQKAMT